jgi:hypothetical protein
LTLKECFEPARDFEETLPEKFTLLQLKRGVTIMQLVAAAKTESAKALNALFCTHKTIFVSKFYMFTDTYISEYEMSLTVKIVGYPWHAMQIYRRPSVVPSRHGILQALGALCQILNHFGANVVTFTKWNIPFPTSDDITWVESDNATEIASTESEVAFQPVRMKFESCWGNLGWLLNRNNFVQMRNVAFELCPWRSADWDDATWTSICDGLANSSTL